MANYKEGHNGHCFVSCHSCPCLRRDILQQESISFIRSLLSQGQCLDSRFSSFVVSSFAVLRRTELRRTGRVNDHSGWRSWTAFSMKDNLILKWGCLSKKLLISKCYLLERLFRLFWTVAILNQCYMSKCGNCGL